MGSVLFHFPSFTSHNHVAQRTEMFALLDIVSLFVDLFLIDRCFDVAYNADCQRQRLSVHHSKLLMEEVGLAVSIVSKHVVDGVSVLTDCHRLQKESVLNQPLVHLLAEEHFLAVAQVDGVVRAQFAVADKALDALIQD